MSCTETATNEDGGEIYFFGKGPSGISLTKTGEQNGTRSEVDKDTTESVAVYACNKDFSATEKRKSLTQRIGGSKISFRKSANEIIDYSENCSSVTKDVTTYDVAKPVDECVEVDWTSSEEVCQPDDYFTRDWTKVGTCDGGVSHPATEEISCTYVAPPVEGNAPTIIGLALPSEATIDENNITTFWGRDFIGNISASENPTSYGVSTSNGYLDSILGNEFTVSLPQFPNTDATADAGTIGFSATNEYGTGNLNRNLVLKNPMQSSMNVSYLETGKVQRVTDHASDGSDLDYTNILINGSGLPAPNDNPIDLSTQGNSIGIDATSDIENIGENTFQIDMYNTYGDQRTINHSFTPATETGARAKIEGTFPPEWEEGVDYMKNGDGTMTFGFIATKNCAYANIGDALSVIVDYKTSTGKTINYTSFDNNLANDLEGYDKLNTCRNSGDSLQISRDPEYSVENKTNEFIN